MPLDSAKSAQSARRRNRLAMSVATLLGLSSPLAFANSVFVTNCSDTGTGSLRNAVSAAADSDTVDMTGLTTSSPGCSASKITLRTGDIVIPQNNLTIKGPGMDKLTVTGKYGTFPNSTIEHNRIFTHNGTGTLTLEYFSMSKGYVDTTNTPAIGGCIYSSGTVDLRQSGVYECTARSSASTALGGGVYAKNGVSAKYSVISANVVEAAGGEAAYGGGIVSADGLFMKYSTVSGNRTEVISGNASGFAGGVLANGDLYIRATTISGNSAAYDVGGLVQQSGDTAKIVNSTITGNSAANVVGGAYLAATKITIYNSTFAFNTASLGEGFAAGLTLASPTIDLESNLLANNTYGSSNDDLDIVGSATVTGHNNLVRVSSASLPSDTITGKCPILGSLRFNGGPTQTLSLQSKSPGIDQGNNNVDANEDQRGILKNTSPYPFSRVSGSAADIGAYEVQQDDIIFTSNFEGCT